MIATPISGSRSWPSPTLPAAIGRSEAREAAKALVAVAREVEPSLNIRLLADLRTVFGDEEQIDHEANPGRAVPARGCALERSQGQADHGQPAGPAAAAIRREVEERPDRRRGPQGLCPRRLLRCLAALPSPLSR